MISDRKLARFGPVEYVRVGDLWTLTIRGYGLCGIGWRIGIFKPR